MADPSSEHRPEQPKTPEPASSLPDEYPLAPHDEGPPHRELPTWVEQKLSAAREKKRKGKEYRLKPPSEPRRKPPSPFPYRELILLTTGITGFLGLTCLRFGGGILALTIIVLGILTLIGLMAWAVLQRRRETAGQSAVEGAAPEKILPVPIPEAAPKTPPFQFTLADLLIAVTAMACLMSLASLVPGSEEKRFSIVAGLSGLGVFVGLIVIALNDEVHRLVRLGWIMLFAVYLFSSLAAIFLK